MAMLKNCEIHHVKCDPKHPNANFNKKNPTWEVQIRTANPEQRDEWIAQNLKPKLMVYKEGTKDDNGEDIGGMPILNEEGKRQWRVNLKKKSITKDGEKASPVKVVTGGLDDVDPNTVGNGSIAHVRIYQYEYTADGKKGIAHVLMGIQLKRHKVYVPKARDDDFEAEDMETIEADDQDGDSGDGGDAPAPKANTPKAPSVNPATARPEGAF